MSETVVLPRPPEGEDPGPAADTVVSKPPPITQPPGNAPDLPETAPPPVDDLGPDPAAPTVVSAPAITGRRTAQGPALEPSDHIGSAPTLSDRQGPAKPGAALELTEVEGDESSASGAPAAAAESGARPVAEATAPAVGTARRVALAASAVFLLALLLGGAGWFYLRGRASRNGTPPSVTVISVDAPDDARATRSAGVPPADALPSGETPVPPAPRRRSTTGATGDRPRGAARRPLPRSGLLRGAVDVSGLASWPPATATVYSGKRFKGRSQTFGPGEVPHLRGTVLHDNAASSLKVVGGARLTLYLKPGFSGRSETFSKDCESLKGTKIRNNRASSLKVEPPPTGPLLWRSRPGPGLGVEVEIERHRDAVVVRIGGHAPPTYVTAAKPPVKGGSLGGLIRARTGLAGALGPARCAAVRIAGGKLAVQLFARGVVVYSPVSKTGWYRLDGT